MIDPVDRLGPCDHGVQSVIVASGLDVFGSCPAEWCNSSRVSFRGGGCRLNYDAIWAGGATPTMVPAGSAEPDCRSRANGRFRQVAAVADLPFVVDLTEDGAGEPQQRRRVGEDPDHVVAEVVEGHKLTNRADAALVQLLADAMEAIRQEVAEAVTRYPSYDELGYAGFTCPLRAWDALDEAADRAEGMRNRCRASLQPHSMAALRSSSGGTGTAPTVPPSGRRTSAAFTGRGPPEARSSDSRASHRDRWCTPTCSATASPFGVSSPTHVCTYRRHTGSRFAW